MEQIDNNLLFRWFVGLGLDDAVWDHSTFSKNRDRLLDADVAAKFLEAVLNAGTSTLSERGDGSRLAAKMRAVAANATQNKIFAIVEWAIFGRPRTCWANGALEGLRCGRSSIRRSAITAQSACAHRPLGNRAIKEVSLCVAVCFGSSDNSAASLQGSTFNRASAERTLSSISFLSTPIGA
jgi:hypothetical protein